MKYFYNEQISDSNLWNIALQVVECDHKDQCACHQIHLSRSTEQNTKALGGTSTSENTWYVSSV